VTAALLEWPSGIAGVRRRASAFNDSRRKGEVGVIGFLAEQPTSMTTAQRNPESKV
jgi:hypothetical protein